MRKSTTLIQLQTLHVITQPLIIEMSPNEPGGTMTMALPVRQKAMVKTFLIDLHNLAISANLHFWLKSLGDYYLQGVKNMQAVQTKKCNSFIPWTIIAILLFKEMKRELQASQAELIQ